MSQENAAVAEEASVCSEEQNSAMGAIGLTAKNLHGLSQTLKEIIFKFKI
jgi:hypothetical protein